MTLSQHVVHVRSSNETVVSFTHPGDETFSPKTFTVTLVLQSSGTVLLELRALGTFMSKYLHHVLRDGEMDERMYGKSSVWTMFPEELVVLEAAASDLRKRGDWDARYAPGSEFTGADITPRTDMEIFYAVT